MMSTLHRTPDDNVIQFTKGAPDVVLSRCASWWDGEKECPMTEERRSEILAANKSMADQALRVLCGAQRSWMEMPHSTAPETLEQQLCYLGLSV